MNQIYVGIDGGGTHSTAVAVLNDGTILRREESGGLNYLTDGLPACTKRLRDLAARVTQGLPNAPLRLCAGLAALDAPAEPDILAAFQEALPQPLRDLDLQSDLYIALMGHTAGAPGLMAVCGTGSMLMALDAQGTQHVMGGWGYRLHDAGSGYSLTRAALIRAVETWEERQESTPLLRSALAFFGAAAPRALIAPLYDASCTPDRFAAFGAQVIGLAEDGDAAALCILRREMAQLSAQAARLLSRVPEAKAVGLYGGVFEHSLLARSLFTGHLRAAHPLARVAPALFPPEIGAVIHRMKQDGVSIDQLPEFKEELS